MVTYHRYATVQGHQLFYREAGPADAPTIVLLHGYPTSSFMFRNLIPSLSDRYHVIAPDLLGFGLSDAPPVDEFAYTFDALTDLTAGLLAQLGINRYAMYVQDYGAAVGWRLAVRAPEAVTAIITQSGNGYETGFAKGYWKPIWEYGRSRTEQTAAALRPGLALEGIKWQYLHGVPDPSVVSPDTWTHDICLIQRPGNDLIQLALAGDYLTNVVFYPRLHEYFRATQVPLLAVWGRNDGIFEPAGARAFQQDLPRAEIHLLDAGHFLLESELDAAAGYIRTFLGGL